MIRTVRLMLGAVCVAACGGDLEVEGSWVETTESGVRWIHNSGAGTWTDDDRWVLEEGLRLGTVEGDSSQQFGRVWALTPIGDSVAVLDGQAQQIHLFGPAGGHLRTFGQQGGGPGEFGRAEGLAVDDSGHIWVVDGRGGRIHEFTSGGEFVRSLPHIPGGTGGLDGEIRVGQSVLEWIFDYPNRDPGSGLVRSQSRFRPVLIDTATHAADTLPGVLAEAEMSGADRVPMTGGVDRTGATDPNEFWFTHLTEYTVYRRSLAGDTLLIVSLDDARLAPVSDRVTDSLSRGDATLRAALPRRFPAIDHILSDRAGHLLVFPHLEGIERYRVMDVFDEQTGTYLGRVDLPVPLRRGILRPRAVEGALYLPDQGPFEVDQIVRLDVVR